MSVTSARIFREDLGPWRDVRGGQMKDQCCIEIILVYHLRNIHASKTDSLKAAWINKKDNRSTAWVHVNTLHLCTVLFPCLSVTRERAISNQKVQWVSAWIGRCRLCTGNLNVWNIPWNDKVLIRREQETLPTCWQAAQILFWRESWWNYPQYVGGKWSSLVYQRREWVTRCASNP